VGDAIVGVVANPLSGRDIRRLVTQASVFPTAEKANMIVRMLTAFGAVGVQRVLVGTDLGGISAAVFRAVGRRAGTGVSGAGVPGAGVSGAGGRWPEVEFLDGRPIRQTAQDTVETVDAVAGVLDAVGASRAHLVGHSMGGTAALAVAAREPGRVRLLTLIARAG
jgi:predicted polyphosphate/ATP-dependent NAD kinase